MPDDSLTSISVFGSRTARSISPTLRQVRPNSITNRNQPDASNHRRLLPFLAKSARACRHCTLEQHGARHNRRTFSLGLTIAQLQPVGKKALAWSTDPVVLCPTVDAPFLCTSANNCGKLEVQEPVVVPVATHEGATESAASRSSTLVAGVASGIVGAALLATAVVMVVQRRRRYANYVALH